MTPWRSRNGWQPSSRTGERQWAPSAEDRQPTCSSGVARRPGRLGVERSRPHRAQLPGDQRGDDPAGSRRHRSSGQRGPPQPSVRGTGHHRPFTALERQFASPTGAQGRWPHRARRGGGDRVRQLRAVGGRHHSGRRAAPRCHRRGARHRRLPMFLYAWLVDRFSPTPRQSAVDLAHVNFAKTYRQLPRSTVDLAGVVSEEPQAGPATSKRRSHRGDRRRRQSPRPPAGWRRWRNGNRRRNTRRWVGSGPALPNAP